MCGILGAFSTLDRDKLQPALESALRQIAHRGPDDSGLEFLECGAGQLALGHRRLSILDLSSAGHQPMTAANGRYMLIFNGEIYNYKELRMELERYGCCFFSDSDSEVLLQGWIRWGKDALSRFEGMFAFSMFDKERRTLFLARDAFGIKPLYYSLTGSELRFCSELPPLVTTLSQKPRLNVQRAYEFLNFSAYDHQIDTFYEGIYRLFPGHYIDIDLDQLLRLPPNGDEARRLNQVRWWNPSVIERPKVSFEDASDELRERFLTNIRLHLRSDVPLGAALSGGLDSSAVVSSIRHLHPDMPIHTFTFVAEGSEVNEKPWSDLINTNVGALDHHVVVSPSELLTDIDDLIRVQGEPFASTSIYAQYRVFKLAKEHGITVMLEGQGADELLAGYDGYPDARIESLLENRRWGKILPFMDAWSDWPGRSKEKSRLLARTALGNVLPKRLSKFLGRGRHVHIEPWLNQDELSQRGVSFGPDHPSHSVEDSVPSGRQLAKALKNALTQGGLQRLLRHGDRNSMRWSIESRVPFLTHNFAEFCLSLPEDYLLSSEGETKHIFRHAMRGIVPDAVIHRRDKVGFATPELEWLRTMDLTEWLDQDVLRMLPFLDAEKVNAHIHGQIHGNVTFNFESWRIINLLKWVRVFSPNT